MVSSTVSQIPGLLPSIALYASAYGDSGLTAQEVMEEILCDALGQMNAFATEETERVAGEVGVFLRNVWKAAKDTRAAKNTTGEGGVKFSREMDTVKALERQKIADAIIGDPQVDFSELRDKARLVANNILQGASYDINWYPADFKKEFKESPMHKNGCRQESY